LDLKRQKVAGGWRRLRNVELRNMYASLYIIRVINIREEISGACSTRARDDKYIKSYDWKT
jgi:hypothetical protein